MNEFREQLIFYANVLWQRRFQALAVAWFVCLVCWIFVITMPNYYQSSARLFIDTSSVLRPLLKGLAIESDVEAELELMQRTLTSRASLANVARLTDLDLRAVTPNQMENLLDSLKARTQVRSEGPKLLTISFVDTDPAVAHRVVQALIDTFVEMNIGHGRDNISAAQRFLDSQIRDYEKQLTQAEKRLADFKNDKLSQLPNVATAQLRIEQLRSEIAETEVALRKATASREVAQRQAQNLTEYGTTSENRTTRRAELETKLQELLSRYTDQHPEVVALRKQLDNLHWGASSKLEPFLNEMPSSADQTRTYANRPEIEKLEFEILQQETDISFYRNKLRRLQDQLANLQRAVSQAPIVEAEFTRLNRDYEVIQGKYQELVSRREQARLSGERENTTEDVQFRVIDSPRQPNSPTGPSRTMLLTVSLLGGLGAGITFALLLGVLSEVVTNPDQLVRAFHLPVIGTVSRIESFKAHTFRVAHSATFLTVLLALFVTYGGLVMAERRMGLANLANDERVAAAYDRITHLPGAMTEAVRGVF